MPVCPKCGSDVADRSYCPKCGADITGPLNITGVLGDDSEQMALPSAGNEAPTNEVKANRNPFDPATLELVWRRFKKLPDGAQVALCVGAAVFLVLTLVMLWWLLELVVKLLPFILGSGVIGGAAWWILYGRKWMAGETVAELPTLPDLGDEPATTTTPATKSKTSSRKPALVPPSQRQEALPPPVATQPMSVGSQVIIVQTPQAPRPVIRHRQRATHRIDFVMRAWMVLLFYLLAFWLPGLIANIMFLSEARSEARRVGYQAPGHGCLVLLFWVFWWIPFLALVAFVLAAVIGGFALTPR